MANPSKGLGRGLAALLGDDVMTPEEEKTSLYLPISQVESCASQPRKQFDPDALADLADSIREHGIIQPLTVRKLQSGYYQIIAGERRWRAARMAGLSEVPAIVIEADEPQGHGAGHDREPPAGGSEPHGGGRGLPDADAAVQHDPGGDGPAGGQVPVRRSQRHAPAEAVSPRAGHGGGRRLSSGHARAILPLSPAMQESAANAIIKDELSVRQTEQLVKKLTAPPSRSSRNRMGSPSIMPRRPPRNWVAVWVGAAALSRAEKRAASNWNTTGWRI